jgi:hypothetical protein
MHSAAVFFVSRVGRVEEHDWQRYMLLALLGWQPM